MKPHSLANLIQAAGISADRAIAISIGGVFGSRGLEIEPEDFLDRAEGDYELGGSVALLNSIRNSRSAIGCAIDKAVLCLGFKPKGLGLRKKLNLLSEVGFLTPSIMRRVSDARNLLEHEYKLPRLKAVEEALELAALFVEATNRNLILIGTEFELGNRDEVVEGTGTNFKNGVDFGFRLDTSTFEIGGWKDAKGDRFLERTHLGHTTLTPDEPLFRPVMRLAIAAGKERPSKTAKAVAKLFDALA